MPLCPYMEQIHVDNLVPETANRFAAAHTEMCNL